MNLFFNFFDLKKRPQGQRPWFFSNFTIYLSSLCSLLVAVLFFQLISRTSVSTALSIISPEGLNTDLKTIVNSVYLGVDIPVFGRPESVAACMPSAISPLAVDPAKSDAKICSEVSNNSVSNIRVKIEGFDPPVTLNIHFSLFRLCTFALLIASAGAFFGIWLVRYFNRATIRHQNEQLKESLSLLASQVAHDIRSPLSAITSMEREFSTLPENSRLLLRSAVNRIHDIANNLLVKNREVSFGLSQKSMTIDPQKSSPTVESQSAYLLSSFVDAIISEKRMQFRSQIAIEIGAKFDSNAYGLFGNIQPTEFKRIVSNLVNNAVEVLSEKGTVTVSISKVGDLIQMRVTDTGRGIPPEILTRLGQRGETHGKAGGSGLGLFHARTTIESWGGKFEIESQVGLGTTVIISLPQAPVPAWFISALKIVPNTAVVVLDDDTSIHQIWQNRFDRIALAESQISVIHCSTPEQLRTWIRDNTLAAKDALYLVDFELIGFQDTGLSLVEELSLEANSILVTSRYEDPKIMKNCTRLGVRMIPKGMAGFVPISLSNPVALVDAILIDDDSLIHLTWEMAAKAAGKQLRAFLHPDRFFEVAESISKLSPVYVDANLGSGIKGEEIAKKVSDLGFKKVYLATGYEPEKFLACTFLSGVLGKEPPF